MDSYSAAGLFPSKLLRVDPTDEHGHLVPYHVQLYPTNACEMSCDFCSCADRKSSLRLHIDEITTLISKLSSMGTRAITLSGGGEPSMHPHFNDIIERAVSHGIKVGLVSHGGQLHKKLASENLTWARISRSDVMEQDHPYFSNLEDVVDAFPGTDWAFSYVLTDRPFWSKLKDVVQFAHANDFTHVRIVSDLLNLENVPTMSEVREKIGHVSGADLILYQGRKNYTAGRKGCRISLLKPVIAADGYVYPCCGAQYALPGSPRDTFPAMRMCHWREMVGRWGAGEHFNGGGCARCYYDQYNIALDTMTTTLDHEEFV